MRGKVNVAEANALGIGITPAYAGKRFMWLHPATSQKDHPRVCGEKTLMHGVDPGKMGSPPRMRGKVETALGMR